MAKIHPGRYMNFIPVILLVITIIYAAVLGRFEVLILSSGIALICSGLKMSLNKILLLVAITTFLGAYLPFGTPDVLKLSSTKKEGFQNEEDDEKEAFGEEKEAFGEEENTDNNEGFDEEEDNEKKEGFDEEVEQEEGFDEEEQLEGFANQKRVKAKKNKSKKVRPPPDNGSRAEPFVLGKKYKIPSEGDDEDYHLDAGTTFLNAYKSLKPDQISAMTKDTQELIDTQKQLMSTLNTLKPLITDGKQIMDTFQNYFGSSGNIGGLTNIAEKFIAK